MGKVLLSNIAEELAINSGLTRDAADKFVHAFVASIEKGLQDDNVVKIKGLGTFKLLEMSDRESVDVNTGERIIIKGYRKVTFTPDSVMKELINRPFAHFEPTELNDGYPEDEEALGMSGAPVDENEEIDTMEQPVVEEMPEVVTVQASEETNIEEAIADEVIADEVIAEETIAEEGDEPIEGESAGIDALDMNNRDTVGSVDKEGMAAKPKTRRSLRGLVVLLLIGVVVGVYHCFFGASSPEEQLYEMEEHSGMMVNPNLEVELRAEWDDGPTAIVEDTDHSTTDSAKVQVAEPAHSTELPDEAKSTPVEDAPYSIVLTEALLAKNLKDITPADTVGYTAAGTLATHKLKHGETIIQLSRQYYGDKRLWPYIVAYNRMRDFDNVAIGQVIRIPLLKEKQP